MWQMLLKAIDEVASAPNAMMAAEMAIIRLTHVSEMPTPERLIKQLQNTPVPPAGPAGGSGGNGGSGGGGPQGGATGSPYSGGSGGGSIGGPSSGGARANMGGSVVAIATQTGTALAQYPTFASVVALIRANRDIRLLVEIETTLRLASYQPGRIEYVPTDRAPKDLASRLGQRLQAWTGNRWAVSIVNEGGAKTIAEVRDAAEDALKAEARGHPLVQAVFDAFPKAKIVSIRSAAEIAAETAVEALPEVEDEWDPFEED
jgi:DNA polymerase-3 subunit gamma/tau